MSNATKKLAGTVKAWMMTLVVEPAQLAEVVVHCKSMGLEPKLCGWQEDSKMILFHLIAPQSSVPNPIVFVPENMGGRHVALMSWKATNLICPPAPENVVKPCRIGELHGMCPECRGHFPVIGPAYPIGSDKPISVMAHHTGELGRSCSGTGMKPLDYDGT